MQERWWKCMKEKLTRFYVDSDEKRILLFSLLELRNQLIEQERYTDCVDELIVKVSNSRKKKVKIKYVQDST